MFAKMVNMAKTPEDVKKEVGEFYPAAPAAATTSAYPYGLCISLEDDTIDKLGMDGEMPGVGEMMQFLAMAKVTSVSQNEREQMDGSKKMCTRIELQITDMGVIGNDIDQQMEKSEARRTRFYGAKADNDA